MKILFVTPYYKPYLGGIERVIEKLGTEFKKIRSGITIHVLTTQWSFPRIFHADWHKNETIDEETIYRLTSVPNVAPPFFQVPLVWFSPSEIKRYLKSEQPDVIQLMSDRFFWVNFWVIFWAKRLKIPVYFSLSFHELSPLQVWLKPINYLITRMVNHVVVITEHEKNLVQKTYQTASSQFSVIPWGVDIPLQPSVHEEKDTLTIIAVGRVSEHKGQAFLARVYKEASFTKPSELVLLGAIEEESVKKEIEGIQLPKDKQIIFTGHVDDQVLSEWYKKADLFALFPHYEAFGLVFLEAMIQSIPVITQNVGAIREVLKKNAVLTEPYDQSDAKKALEELGNNPSRRKELAEKGYQYVKETYSWETTAKSYFDLYTQTS